MSVSPSQAPVTVLGLGPMGQSLAGAFLAAGHPTTLWNRTPGRAPELVNRGALEAGSAAEAIAASPLVVICVLDYDAVHAILEPHSDALKGRTLVNLTADTPERARAAAAWAEKQGITYLDGAIMVPTQLIGTPDTLVLHSGPADAYAAHESTLAAIGGRAVHLGEDPARAAAFDVALLDVFWTGMTGIVHAFTLAATEGVAARDLAPFAQGVAELLPYYVREFATQIDTGNHPPEGSNLRSAAAIMAHVREASEARGIDASVITAAHEVALRGIAAGFAENSYSRVVEINRNTDLG
ncbi:NAD(P)-dependent oxidoreductase [Streptomyces sp. NPDC051561]|uniref:NAD(P)-dependent oxidoreductase n=1 Tax=Streptomyces sp. NPDC051561 TaxID=3365658 RepID=UPI0037AF9E88